MSKRSLNIGRKLKAARHSQGLTLEELSKMASVSKAMLSQIEQDKVNPTVAIIIKIADALGVGIGTLIDMPTEKNILRVIPESDKHYTFRADNFCTIRTLSPLSLEKTIEFYRITIEAHGELSSEPHFAGTEECLYVAKGKLSITSGQESTVVSKGDSIHFRADVPHTLKNIGKDKVEIYLITRYK